MLADLAHICEGQGAIRDLANRNLDHVHQHLDNLTVNLGTRLGQDNIRCRWQIFDALDGLLYPPSTLVRCLLCGYEAPRATYATKVANCIFGGGRLERYVCPECGCTFGPLKMMALDEQSLGREYTQHYQVHSEGDSKWKEHAAFMALNPVKGGKYLNFGAGAWSKTTIALRDEGWNVWDYEPYAPVDARTWVLRSKEELSRHQFDGIFSNDVMEHFKDPVAALKEMRTVLKPDGLMAHCSGCYEYACEHTRFHYVFFTGGALKKVASLINMTIELQERLREDDPARIALFRV